MPKNVIELPVKRATDESFAQYGVVIDPKADKAKAVEVLQVKGVFAYYPQREGKAVNPGGETLIASPLEMCPRLWAVTEKMEYHLCNETLIFYDRVVVVVGPQAVPGRGFEALPSNQWAAFAVGANCWLKLRPRILHALAFPWDDRTVAGHVLLPLNAHNNNCHFVDFPEGMVLQPVRPATFPRR